MLRYITPIILIGISIAGFLMFAKPIIGDISNKKNEIISYNEALDNSKALENERDKLTQKYNAINPADLVRLQKFLPDNVDNIRIILEIEKIALPYGMVLKDVKYDSAVSDKTATATNTNNTTNATAGGSLPQNTLLANESSKKYGTWNLSFSTEGTYSNFINFTKDLQNNLRMVDISSVTFSSDSSVVLGKPKVSDLYKYDFKIKTYWLKN